jgi:hypothetical protein
MHPEKTTPPSLVKLVLSRLDKLDDFHGEPPTLFSETGFKKYVLKIRRFLPTILAPKCSLPLKLKKCFLIPSQKTPSSK